MGGGKKIKRIKLLLGRMKAVKTWQLFLILILALFATASSLRFDHVRMTDLRAKVLAADADENDILLSASLNELSDFVAHHIVVNVVDDNGLKKLEFGTGVFYLEGAYLRATSEALEATAEAEIDDSNPNGNIYALASAICRPLAIANGWAWNSAEYISCWQTELSKYPASSETGDTLTVSLPSTELYRREFLSPVWAPTLSGFLILFSFILTVVIFIRFLIWLILEITLYFLKFL